MIRFKAINVDGKEIEYTYQNKDELERIWRSDDIEMYVPANDDPIYDVEIDGEEVYVGRKPDKDERESDVAVWFEDLLTYLGIDIWGQMKGVEYEEQVR